MLAQCQNEDCPSFKTYVNKRGRDSFGQIFLDEPHCEECEELLVVVGGAAVLS